MAPHKERRWLVTLRSDGVFLGTFDSFRGGEIEGRSDVYHGGGMERPSSQVDPPEVSPIEISRGWRPLRDAQAETFIASRIGIDCVVSKQALDASGQPIAGTLKTYNGRFTKVSTPEHDSMGTNWNRFTVGIVPEGLPS